MAFMTARIVCRLLLGCRFPIQPFSLECTINQELIGIELASAERKKAATGQGMEGAPDM